MEAVTTQWQRIEAHLLTLPQIPQPFLNPGATDEEIATAEAATGGFPFSEDFRSSLKRHNGQATYHVILGIGALLSTQEIVDQWSVWQELLDAGTFEDFDEEVSSEGGHVKPKWWNPRWIPITHDGGGDHDCLDMDPGEAGTVGQIVQMWHDDGNRPLQAKSYLAWLTECADKLEDGRLVWDDVEGFSFVDAKEGEQGSTR